AGGHRRRRGHRPGRGRLHGRAVGGHRGARLARRPPGAAVPVRQLGRHRGRRARPGAGPPPAGRPRPPPGPGPPRRPGHRAAAAGRGGRSRRLGPGAEPYQSGRAGRLLDTAEMLTVGGLTAAAIGGRNRVLAAVAGAALVASSALTRFGVFYAGRASARDPKYTITPHKDRIRAASPPPPPEGPSRAPWPPRAAGLPRRAARRRALAAAAPARPRPGSPWPPARE